MGFKNQMMDESQSEKPLEGEVVESASQQEQSDPRVSSAERTEVTAANAARIISSLPAKVGDIKSEVGKCVVGQEENTEAILYALFSYGHCLLEGVPGLGKTLLVGAISRVLHLEFKRIQFTPDLMPPDITGTDILQEEESGHREFQFVRGPIYTQILLADEINRTPPKTQAALLEAMQERTVTVSGRTDQLPEPFLVLATQNPIEQEGTYPLPEAQLDRFLFQLQLGYPTHEQEKQIVAGHSFTPLDGLTPQLTWQEVMAYRDAIAHIPSASNVIDYATRLVRATRPGTSDIAPGIAKWIRWGASPRASQNLILAGRARAACLGRFNVACEDIAAVAPMVLRHRIIRSFQADAEQKTTDDIIEKLIAETPHDAPQSKR